MNITFKIEGLSCGHCVNAVTNLLNEVEGVKEVKVALPDVAQVDYEEEVVTVEQLKQVINNSAIYKAL